MNTKILHRLLWKEFRALRPLWLAICGAAIVLQFGLVWVIRDPDWRRHWIMGVALTLPTVYALACTAMSFAGEADEGTDQLLCRLAISPWPLLLVKYGLCLASTVLMLVVLLPSAVLGIWMSCPPHMLFSSNLRELLNALVVRSNGFGWLIGFLSWGLTCSLLFRRVLPCIIGTLLATVVTPLLFAVADWWHPWVRQSVTNFEFPLRFGVLPVGLLLVSTWLVGRWDEGRFPALIERAIGIWNRLSTWRDVGASASSANAILPDDRISQGSRIGRIVSLRWPEWCQPLGSSEFGRLLWLEWGLARRMLVKWTGVFAVFLLLVMPAASAIHGQIVGVMTLLLALMSLIFGVRSFQSEQRDRQFRLLAGHGVSPLSIWLSKQIVWLTSAVGFVFAVTGLASTVLKAIPHFYLSINYADRSWAARTASPWASLLMLFSGPGVWFHSEWNRQVWQHLGWPIPWLCGSVLVAVWLCFSVGQCASLLMSRGVTALIVGGFAGAAFFAWLQLSWAYNIPLAISVWPIIFGCLLATAIRMSDWLEERNRWRDWLKVLAAAGIPIGIALTGTACFRAFEWPVIPAVRQPWVKHFGQNIDVSMKDSVSGNETLAAWRRLAESVNPPGDSKEDIGSKRVCDIDPVFRGWLIKERPTWDSAAQNAERKECARFDVLGVTDTQSRQSLRIVRLLRLAGLEAVDRGEFDEAATRARTLVRLAEHLEQHGGFYEYRRAHFVTGAALDVARAWALSPRQSAERLRQTLAAGLNEPADSMAYVIAAGQQMSSSWRVARQLFVEMQIAQRDAANPPADSVTYWCPWERIRSRRLLDHRASQAYLELIKVFRPEEAGFRLPSELDLRLEASMDRDDSVLWMYGSHNLRQLRNEMRAQAADCRATLLTIALQAFQLEHGQLPNQLEELVGDYLSELPLDPWTDRPFAYHPKGFSADIRFANQQIVPAGTPVLWVGGPNFAAIIPTQSPPAPQSTEPTAPVTWLRVHRNGTREDASKEPRSGFLYELEHSVAWPLVMN